MPTRRNPRISLETNGAALIREIAAVESAVRSRAYEISRNGAGFDADTHNWLRAEAETITRPTCELIRTKAGCRFEFAVPGLEAEDVTIFFAQGRLILKGERKSTRTGKDERVLLTEVRATRVFREVMVPEDCNPGKSRAQLTKGILTVTLPSENRAERKPGKARPRRTAATPKPAGRTRNKPRK